jgi:capsular polysaccharide biosynthesis protein
MDLDSTLVFTRRWIWLFALCAISAAAVGLIVSMLTPPTYEATSRLLVGQSLTTNQVDYNDILASKEMAQTYAQLATFGPTIEAAAALVAPPMDPAVFAKAVRVRAPASTTFVEITGSAETAQQAADIANALARELIILATPPVAAPGATPSPTPKPTPAASLAPGETPAPTASPTPAPSANASPDIGVGTLTLVDPATPPSSSVGPRTILNTVVAGLIGLAVGVVAAFVLTRPTSTGEDRA